MPLQACELINEQSLTVQHVGFWHVGFPGLCIL
jgi:hypothetical protein